MSAVSQTSVSRAVCLNHPQREAAARCVGCGKRFCKECVTQLEVQWFCAACLKERTAVKVRVKRDGWVLSVAVQALVGAALLWITVAMAGKVLIQMPTDFHEGSVWQKVTDLGGLR
jgi:ubiquitin C-terminal hydrolase